MVEYYIWLQNSSMYGGILYMATEQQYVWWNTIYGGKKKKKKKKKIDAGLFKVIACPHCTCYMCE